MKQRLLRILGTLLACCLLVSCGGGGSDVPAVNAPAKDPAPVQEEPAQEPAQDAEEEPAEEEPPLEENVIYSKEGISLTVNSLTQEDVWWKLAVTVSNQTEHAIEVAGQIITFDGWVCDGAGGLTECAANSTVDAVWEFNSVGLAYAVAAGELKSVSAVGIQPTITVHAAEGDDYIFAPLRTAQVDKLPVPNADQSYAFVRESGKVVFENELYKVTCLGVAPDFTSISEYPQIYFRVDNAGDQPITVTFDEAFTDYADIVESMLQEKECFINGQVCPCSVSAQANVSAGSSAILAHALYLEDISLGMEDVARYQKAYEISGMYWYAPDCTVEDTSFAADVQFE